MAIAVILVHTAVGGRAAARAGARARAESTVIMIPHWETLRITVRSRVCMGLGYLPVLMERSVRESTAMARLHQDVIGVH